MAYKLIFFCGAIGVAALALALAVTATIGFVVWLSGTDWARRPELRRRA